MLSRLYCYLLPIFVLLIWLDPWKNFDFHDKLFFSPLLLAGIPPMMWLDTMMRSGLGCLRSVPRMLRLFGRSRRGNTLTAIMVFCLLFWLSPFATTPLPHRFEMSAALVLSVALLWLQPPFALVLGESDRSAGNVLKAVSDAVYPGRTVALLDPRRTGHIGGSFGPLTDCIRTQSDHDWRDVVDKLADLVTLIVLDARTNSPFVVSEVQEILGRSNRLKRTLFIVDSDGTAPALAAIDQMSLSPGLWTAQDNQVESLLTRWLLRCAKHGWPTLDG